MHFYMHRAIAAIECESIDVARISLIPTKTVYIMCTDAFNEHLSRRIFHILLNIYIKITNYKW